MAVHAAVDIAMQQLTSIYAWSNNSNSLVVLSVANEKELFYCADWIEFNQDEIKSLVVKYYEPDYDDQLMSISVFLNSEQAKVVSNLPLLLKGYK